MLEWDGLRFLLALYEKKTLKAAAAELEVDQTTVGRRIVALEAQLGTRVFKKSSEGYFLTLAGERILPTVRATEQAILSLQRSIAGEDDQAVGKVRIAMPGALANHWLIPRISPLLRKHSKLEIEFLTGPEVVNLARRDADLALRLVRPTQKDLIVRKIGKIELALYGHSSLWKRLHKPMRPEDIETLPFIGLFEAATSELERSMLRRIEPYLRYSLRSAAWSSVFNAVQSGLGIGVLPTFMVDGNKELIRLTLVDSVQDSLWLVVHPEIVKSARVRAVMDFISSLYEK